MSKKDQKKRRKSLERQINNSWQIIEEFKCGELKRIIYRNIKTKYKSKGGRSSKVHTYTAEEIREYQKTNHLCKG